jgi:hypothetical protein
VSHFDEVDGTLILHKALTECRDFSFVLSPDTNVMINPLAAEGGVSDVALGEYGFPFRLAGSGFQHSCMRKSLKIPYGPTRDLLLRLKRNHTSFSPHQHAS